MVAIPNAVRTGDLKGSDPVPEGTYHVRIDKAEYKTSGQSSKAPGTPMVACHLTIFGPESAEQYHGRKIFDNVMLAGDGSWRLKQLLKATGHDDDFILDDTDLLLKLELAVTVKIEPAGTGADGKEYDAKNVVMKYIAL